jgi:TonB-linked SusC/RagA family outer membrane protein
MMRKMMFLLVFLIGLSQAFGQEKAITGKVVDENGAVLPGATILLKGTAKGAVTDINGQYSINVPASGGVLIYSYVGYLPKEAEIGTNTSLNIGLTPDVQSLDQVVVVGYGVQKKSLNTGSISKIDSKDITAAPVQRIDQALQGKTSGVFMAQQSGSPGSPMSVKIRGNSSNGTNGPLYIVDGVKTGNIDYLSPSDIESMEVLKDAASCAIYGTEGGNGVIMITTKKGVKGTPSVDYSYNHGWQMVGHTVSVMNAQEFVDYQKQAYRWEHLKNAADSVNYNNYATSYFPNIAGQATSSTNWQDQVFQAAPVDEHHISFSGGNDKGAFMFSASYLNQDGIVGGSKSNYTRYTFLFNGEQKLKDWLTVGSNVSYTKSKRNVLSESNEFGGIVTNTIFFDPTVPVTYADSTKLPAFIKGSPEAIRHLIKNSKGEYYSISNFTSGEAANPLALIDNTHNTQSIDKILGAVHADVNILKSLKFTTRLSMDYSLQYDDIFSPTFYYNGQNNVVNDTLSTIRNQYVKYYKYSFENFVTYNKTFGDHAIEGMAGMSYENYRPQYIDVTGYLVPENNINFAYLYNTSAFPRFMPKVSGGLGIGSNAQNQQEAGNTQQSYFGRLNYSYKEKYMLEGTIRRDGSSLFGPKVRYVVFPSFSTGWNLSKEDFFKDNISFINNAKLRFSWGQNGSDQALYSYAYTSLMSSTGQYYSNSAGTSVPGWVPVNPGNATLKWETSQQLDGGIDLALLNNKVTFSTDYYDKRTIDQLVANSRVPYYLGYNTMPWANMGEVENKGWEFDLAYRQMEGDFKYSVSVNATYLQNKVISYGDSGASQLGSLVGTSGDYVTKYESGKPAWYFYGYKAIGIFQTKQDVLDYSVELINGKPKLDNNGNEIIFKKNAETDAQIAADGGKRQYLQKTAVPGDVKYADANKDGSIGLTDKTNLGNPWPAWTYGINLNCEYKGVDLNAFFQGVQGNQLFYAILRGDHPEFNKPEYYYTKAWNGPGTSTTYPRASFDAATTAAKNYYYSSLNVFSGNYIRLKNVTLGYTLPADLTKKVGISKLRVYTSAINLLTFTKYPGSDPEVGQDINYQSNNQSYGVDRGLYPSSKTYNVGVNVTF